MSGVRFLLAAAAAALALGAATARADILASPDATKVCAGYDGTGITWNIGLNEGWRPSRDIHYRVTLLDPHGVKRGFRDGSTGGYWDSGTLAQGRGIYDKREYPARVGTYTFILGLEVDPRYPDIGAANTFWPARAGRWINRTWKIHVFACST